MPTSKRISKKTRNDPLGYFRLNSELTPLIQIARANGEAPSITQINESNRFYKANKDAGVVADMSLFRDFALCPELNPIGGPKISFTRASGATRVNQQGLIEYAPENLIIFSEELDNASWTKTNVTVLSNQTTSPYGDSSADLVTDTNSSSVFCSNSASVNAGTSLTLSFFVKRGNTDWVRLIIGDSSGTASNGCRAWFNLTTGLVGSGNSFGNGAYISHSIQNAGDGWYRIYLSGSGGSSATTVFGWCITASANDSTDRVVGGSRYLWGAQLERSEKARKYNPTTNSAYYSPRFNYDPITKECLGLLIEESRTNLYLYSNDFSNTWWTSNSTNITISSAGSVGPLQKAWNIVPTSGSSSKTLASSVFSLPATHSRTIFAKANGYRYIQANWSGTFGFGYVNFDLQTGVVGTQSDAVGRMTPYPDGWYLLEVIATGTASTAASAITIVNSNSAARGASMTGDGVSGVLLSGAQLELGGFPTSYIPTFSSTVTRAVELITIPLTNLDFYNPLEGTLLAHGYSTGRDDSTIGCAVSINNGGINQEEITIGHNTLGQILGAYVYASSSLDVNFTKNSVVRKTSNNSIIAYKYNDFAGTHNGDVSSTDNLGNIPTGINRICIGRQRDGNLFLNGTIKRVVYYSKRLPNAFLQSLTA